VLNGESSGTAAENIVALNAATSIGLAHPTMTKVESIAAARESVRSGNARRKMEVLVAAIPA
jgi:anthranilate phosphoribosyltransferase